MSELETQLFLPGTVRELDRIAIQDRGIPGYELMCRAGQVAFEAARQRYPDAHRWLVCCGGGNNAGDGYVVARLARAAGLDAYVHAIAGTDGLTGDARTAWHDYEADGGKLVALEDMAESDLLIDAIFGTGLDRDIEGRYRDVVEWINAQGRPVLAIDIPSGIHGATGVKMGVAVLADLTVTFVGQKTGLFLADGREHCGVLLFDAIGIPQDVADGFEPEIRLFTSRDLARVLPTRGRAAHKGDFGHVAVVGGNHGMGGAVRLAGEAALRCGAGLVTVLTRPENIAAVTGYCPELMCQGVESAADFRAAIRRATVIAVGPGLGQDDWARLMLEQVSRSTLATVADADALNLLAEAPARKPGWIITPHPGEAATLLGCSTVEVQRARVDAARALAEKFDCTAVLKGSGTLVVGPGSTPWLIRQGNPGMASAGMGDVLTGITAGMVAQAGSDAAGRVAAAAAFVHACAGDSAASAGERGIIASELFVHLRPWLNP